MGAGEPVKASHRLKLAALACQGVAEFVGIQFESADKAGKGFGLYNIRLKGNPLDGSTVTAETIKRMGIRVKEVKPCFMH